MRRTRTPAVPAAEAVPSPVITLTSCFSVTDHYLGALKGVILFIVPV